VEREGKEAIATMGTSSRKVTINKGRDTSSKEAIIISSTGMITSKEGMRRKGAAFRQGMATAMSPTMSSTKTISSMRSSQRWMLW
jgi:hypothetical protein